jgi:hypothetical protein
VRIDPGRLARALDLAAGVVPEPQGVYRVSDHVVDTSRQPWNCNCPDAVFRPGVRCKHVLAVYLHRQLAGPVLEGLRCLLTPACSLRRRALEEAE